MSFGPIGYSMLIIRFEEDFCDQELTSLHLSFIVKEKEKEKEKIYMLISPTLLDLLIKGRSIHY
jgi:hypothetical protein